MDSPNVASGEAKTASDLRKQLVVPAGIEPATFRV